MALARFMLAEFSCSIFPVMKASGDKILFKIGKRNAVDSSCVLIHKYGKTQDLSPRCSEPSPLIKPLGLKRPLCHTGFAKFSLGKTKKFWLMRLVSDTIERRGATACHDDDRLTTITKKD